MSRSAKSVVAPTVVNQRRTMKISESVTRDIVADISKMAPGTMLPPTAKLLERYNVGRASLREALRVLEIQGLIIIRPGPGGGPMVAQADSAHFGRMASLFFHMGGATYHDVLEARLILEPALAAMIAERHDPDDIEALEDFVRGSAEEVTTDDVAPYVGVEFEAPYSKKALAFHTMLIDMAGNPVLTLLTHCLQDQGIADQHGQLLSPDDQRSIDMVHNAIAEAIIAGDAAQAELLMREHMHHYRRLMMARQPAGLDAVVSWREFNQ